MIASSEFSVRPLSRGGQVITWGDFVMQVGAYPETIKDTMQTSEGVPQLFLVPEQLFDTMLGVSAAELEFPVYFNFYLKQRKIRFICRKQQLRPITRVLKEAVFGPSSLSYEEEFLAGSTSRGYPDLATEMRWYKADPKRPRGRLCLKDMITPIVFDENGQVEVDGVRITDLGHDRYRLEQNGEAREFTYEKPDQMPFGDVQEPGARYKPPGFGVTVLGSGHGFDARSLTSGFIIWINGKGVLVDPPVHTTEWLKHSHIDGRLVDDIVLTHCHADHDSGTLQKVLEEGRVTVHTTPTVMDSFVRKYRSLTGLSGQQFRQLFDFRPVPIGQSVNIAGGNFLFKYTLHPIPTLGFSLTYQGKSFAYSCDTLYDPPTMQKLHEEGVLSKSRLDDLLDFPWHADLILHEAGIPPIHTPMSVLQELPDDVKERMFITHVSESAIPKDSGLRLAPPGVENTIIIDVSPPDVSHAQQMLDVLAHIDLFQSLSISRAAEFLRIAHYSRVPAGSVIVRTDERGDTFHIILSGEAEVHREGKMIKLAGRFDYFGEIALVLDRPRIADVVARTEIELLTIKRQEFMDFIRGTEIPELFRRVSLNKMEGSWSVFSANRMLGHLSTFQKTQLLSWLTRRDYREGETLFSASDEVEEFVLLSQGDVRLGNQLVGRGALLGRVTSDLGPATYEVDAVAVTPVVAHTIPAKGMHAFFRANPGSFIRVLRVQDQPPVGGIL